MRRSIVRFGFVLVPTLSFIACGDGSPTDTDDGDTTRPIVASVTPIAGAADVAIGTTLTVTFSEPIDPATVTTATFAVTGPDGAVAGSVTLAGNVATFTPAGPLTEHASTYTAMVTTGVRDTAGNPLGANRSWQFTTEMVSALYWYRLSNDFLGDDRSLASGEGAGNECYMGATGDFPGQYWKFAATPPGMYRMTSQSGGPALSLESGDGSGPCSLDPTGDFTGQNWLIVPYDGHPHYFRLQTQFLGDSRSLEGGTGTDVQLPFMSETGNFGGQAWKIRRIGPI